MNWEAAKSWLIAVFLVLDLVLGWQYIQSRQEAASYTESYSDLVANTKTLLAQHNFSLAAAIPQDHPVMAPLETGTVHIPYSKLQQTVFPNAKQRVLDESAGLIDTDMGELRFQTPYTWRVDYTTPLKVGGKSGKSLLSYVWNGNSYQMDNAMTGGEFIVYDEVYQQHPLFDASLILHEASGKLAGYEQTTAGIIHMAGQPKPTISAVDALTSLANSVDKSGSPQDNVIEHIDLGYALKPQGSGNGTPSSKYWFPVWRVVTSSKQVYEINAFTGEINLGT